MAIFDHTHPKIVESTIKFPEFVPAFFFNWDSLHARLNTPLQGIAARKRSTKRLKHTRNLFRKNLELLGV